MTLLTLAIAWMRARRAAQHTRGLPVDGRKLTAEEDRQLSQMALLHYLTAADPQARKAPRGRKR
jgi:hypothetical protein